MLHRSMRLNVLAIFNFFMVQYTIRRKIPSCLVEHTVPYKPYEVTKSRIKSCFLVLQVDMKRLLNHIT